jgi:pimeloyl-ACP methyl ester carboxylesterase
VCRVCTRRWHRTERQLVGKSEFSITTAHERQIRVEISGDDNGIPVFLLHGMPGSRSGPKPRASVLYRRGIRLISYDRPGYGGSTRHRDRRVADAAADVAAIADALHIERFSVVGRSGGGPHALACAALLGERIGRVAVLVGFAAPDAADLEWFEGMAQSNTREFAAATVDPRSLADNLQRRWELALQDPENLLRELDPEMIPEDRRVVEDLGIRQLLTRSYTEALRAGPYGWIDDLLALRRDWGFSLDAIRSPVRLWHGEQDSLAPVSHTWWLAHQIPSCEVIVQPDAAHFGAVEILPEMLAWVAEWHSAWAVPRPADGGHDRLPGSGDARAAE